MSHDVLMMILELKMMMRITTLMIFLSGIAQTYGNDIEERVQDSLGMEIDSALWKGGDISDNEGHERQRGVLCG